MAETAVKFNLEWDKDGERYYETGIDRGVLFVKNSSGVYGSPVVWNGLTGVDESPDGADANDVWADNTKYAVLRSAENFKATIKAYTYPDEFNACDGSASPAGGVYVTQQNRSTFAFSYRTKVSNDNGLDAYKLHIVYGATASPSSKSYATVNDSPDAMEMSWEIETIPVAFTDAANAALKPTAHIIIDSREADSTKLAAFEQYMYGTVNGSTPTVGKLPTPDEVISKLKTA